VKVSKQTYYPLQNAGILTAVRMFALVLSMTLVFSASSFTQMIKILSPEGGSISSLHSQGVTAKGWTGFEAELWVNGVQAQRGAIRGDGFVDFINVPVPTGDVLLEARLVNPDGSPIQSDTVRIHVLGEPSSIKVEMDEEEMRANGSSTLKGHFQVLDYWGYALKDYVVTVSADSGNIVTKDLDLNTAGTQIRLVRGFGEFEYKAGKNSGTATITAQAEQVKSSVQIHMLTPLEPFTLIGLVDGSASSMKANGDLTRLTDKNSFPDGMTAEGRLAAYARGTIGEDYLLTASYDSDRRNRARLFRDLDPDYLYSMYGDNSLLYYDVQTQSPLFAKIEKNQSYAIIGDYNSEINSQEFTRYDRALNGIKVSHQDSKWKIKGFGSLTDHQVKHDEIRGEGLSGYYYLSSSHITPGSERLHVETRDKYHSEIIIRSADKFRFSDFEIDYDQGTIFFKQPVSAFDADGNPVWIVVTYEAITDNASTYLAGASVEHNFTDDLSVGVTGITEEQSPKNYNLFGANAKYQLGGKYGISGEVAHSSDFASTPNEKSSGNAYKIEVTGAPLDNLSLRSYYRRMEEGFYNIRESGGRKERGSIKYGVNGNYQLTSKTKFASEYYETLQDLERGQSKLASFTGAVEHRFTDRLFANFRVEDIRYSIDSLSAPVRHSTLGVAGASYVAAEKLKLTAQHERNLGSTADATKPNATALMAEYRLLQSTALSAEERFYEGGGNMATLGVNSMVTEGTQVYGKYEIGNSIAGRRNMISMGIRNTVKLPLDLTMSLGYERAKDLSQRIDQTPTNDHVAYSAGLEYLPKEPIKASTKIEFGESNTAKKTNFFFAGDYRFQRDFSFILKYNLAKENAVINSNYRNLSHLILGVAYRPTESNAINAIGKFEIKGDNNHYLAPFIDYGAVIGSIHTYIEPMQRLELGIKLAYKVASENSEQFSVSTHTTFYLLRATYDITEKFDVGMEYRALVQSEANDILNGYSADIGYVVMTNLKLMVGYNFKGYKDRDLVDNNMWSAGPFVKFSYKFGEELFGK
jgi:hypothetical protein